MDYDTFSTLLSAILRHTYQLHELLVRENQTLRDRNAEQMEALAAEKSDLVSELNRLTDIQEQHLRHENLPADKRGIEAFFDRKNLPADEQKQLRSLWSKVRQATEKCQTTNETNALTIELLRRNVQQSLDILRGGTDEGESTYGPNGHQTHKTASKSLAAV